RHIFWLVFEQLMEETSTSDRSNKYKRIYNRLININLFDDNEELSFEEQLCATRIFLSLLIISLSIVIISTSYSVRTNTVIIQSPNQNNFEKLSIQYPTTL
ncbi:unnamed protein product, partial [Rotaria sordida]